MRLYSIAFFIAGVAIVYSSVSGNYAVRIPYIVSFILFAIGFLRWAWAIVIRIWEHPLGKIAVAIFHAFVAVFAHGCAGMVVSETFGLPSKDFTTTVGVLSIWFSPFVWIAMASMVSLVLLVLFGVLLLLLSITTMFGVNHALVFIARPFSSRSRFWHFVEHGRNRASFNLSGHFVGVCALSLMLAQVWDSNFKFCVEHPWITKLLAYKFDYQDLYRYPGVEHGQKVMLHDNNIISYAHIEGRFDITIQVGRYRNTDSDEKRRSIPQN